MEDEGEIVTTYESILSKTIENMSPESGPQYTLTSDPRVRAEGGGNRCRPIKTPN